MQRHILKNTLWLVIPGAMILLLGCATLTTNPSFMVKDDLRLQLDNPQLVVLDVRTGADWKSSEFKIKGALRANPQKFKDWSNKYPKDKTLVLYCA